ncbi:AAA family ATPase [Moorella naiadis]|uniref:hypothetical protein n=1 Tax=Moorella naiadis (nom. illeg.) TaxID=3093670 RepID=UPI003D9CBAF7
MFFNSLILKNFKGTPWASYEFGPETKIYGDNRTGKTTIAEAIVFASHGTNLNGSNRTENFIMQGAKSADVTLRFTDDTGKQHTITRARGKQKQLYLTLDGADATQEKMEEIIGPRKQFMAAFWPVYILGIGDSEAREFFVELLPKIPPEKILENMDDPFREALTGFNLSDPQKLAGQIRDEIKAVEKEIAKLEGALEEAQKIAGQAVPDEIDITKLEEEYRRLDAALQGSHKDEITMLEREVAKLAGEYQTLKRQYESLSPTWKPGDICPTCGQVIGEEVIEKAAKAVNVQKEAIKEKANAVAARGKKAQAELKALKEKAAQDVQGMAARRDELLKEITAAREQNAVRMNILRAKEKAAENVTAYQEQLRQDREALDRMRVELQAVAQYTAKQAEMMSEALVAHFKKASVNLFEVVKSTGEVKPVFKLLYDGKPVQVLSTSEKVKLGLEISAAVKELAGKEWPTFVDNGESITEFEAPRGQFFVAKVVEGKELEVICADAQRSAA